MRMQCGGGDSVPSFLIDGLRSPHPPCFYQNWSRLQEADAGASYDTRLAPSARIHSHAGELVNKGHVALAVPHKSTMLPAGSV